MLALHGILCCWGRHDLRLTLHWILASTVPWLCEGLVLVVLCLVEIVLAEFLLVLSLVSRPLFLDPGYYSLNKVNSTKSVSISIV